MERGKWREAGYPVYWRRHFKIYLLREGGYRTDTTESGGYRRQKRQRPDIGRSLYRGEETGTDAGGKERAVSGSAEADSQYAE